MRLHGCTVSVLVLRFCDRFRTSFQIIPHAFKKPFNVIAVQDLSVCQKQITSFSLGFLFALLVIANVALFWYFPQKITTKRYYRICSSLETIAKAHHKFPNLYNTFKAIACEPRFICNRTAFHLIHSHHGGSFAAHHRYPSFVKVHFTLVVELGVVWSDQSPQSGIQRTTVVPSVGGNYWYRVTILRVAYRNQTAAVEV